MGIGASTSSTASSPSASSARDRAQLQERTFPTNVDHFSYQPVDPPTFPLRYFVGGGHYLRPGSAGPGTSTPPSPPPPVLFYAGNEADITVFIENSGFVFEAAEELGALVVFAEHRYYGTSYPFGGRLEALSPGRNVSYLTVEQALADFNLLTHHLREQWNLPPSTAFVAVGGSYGANLAMWLRLKFPHLWAGALASSATPLKGRLRTTNAFHRIVAEAYGNATASGICPSLVRDGWTELYGAAASPADRTRRVEAARTLGLCRDALPPTLAAADRVRGWIYSALETMVQYGYPYPSAFYEPLPAHPHAVACAAMEEAAAGAAGGGEKSNPLAALRAAADLYYNSTGQAGRCYGWEEDAAAGPGRWAGRYRAGGPMEDEDDASAVAWDYQCCTEVYQPMPSDGVTDMQLPAVPNRTEYFDRCRRRWGVVPRPDWEEGRYGGNDLGPGASNLFLTSGQIDPWRAGGIQTAPVGGSDPGSVVVRILEGAAHHLDLRASDPGDPPSVVQVRAEELEAMRGWVRQWGEAHPGPPVGPARAQGAMDGGIVTDVKK